MYLEYIFYIPKDTVTYREGGFYIEIIYIDRGVYRDTYRLYRRGYSGHVWDSINKYPTNPFEEQPRATNGITGTSLSHWTILPGSSLYQLSLSKYPWMYVVQSIIMCSLFTSPIVSTYLLYVYSRSVFNWSFIRASIDTLQHSNFVVLNQFPFVKSTKSSKKPDSLYCSTKPNYIYYKAPSVKSLRSIHCFRAAEK